MPRASDSEHVIVWKEDDGYLAWPNIVCLGSDEFLVMVHRGGRLAREVLRKGGVTHSDPDFRAHVVRSTDGGRTWEPRSRTLIYDSHCVEGRLGRTSDGTLIYTCGGGYRFAAIEERDKLGADATDLPDIGLAVGLSPQFLIRSFDGGRAWENEPTAMSFGSMQWGDSKHGVVETEDGVIWILALSRAGSRPQTGQLMRSTDKGNSWTAVGVIPELSAEVSFFEPSLCYLGAGKFRSLIRSGDELGLLYCTWSDDGGETWSRPERQLIWADGPADVVSLKDGRVAAVYGHRRRPFGIRACTSPDGKSWRPQDEVILRDDCSSWDCGYPGAVQLDDGRMFSVYYMNREETGDRARFIAGTFWRF